jgi:alkylresorcinol/alkylpyrone synthase
MHPGGRKVLEAVEAALGLPRQAFEHSWQVLANYGNMSSPTALFVLDRTIDAGASGRHLMAAFGPGFSISFALLDL